MKISIKTLLILFTAIVLVNCDSNDDLQTDPVNPTDGFTHHQNNTTSIFYETTNAYIEIDEDQSTPGVPDYYTFFFLNGRLLDNNTKVNGTSDEVLLSLNTTNYAAIQISTAVNTSLNTGIPPSSGHTYVASRNDSVIITDFSVDGTSPQTSVNINGTYFEFGEGDENSGTLQELATAGHAITINAMVLDTVNPENSTINVDYTVVNSAGELISGHYEGTLGVFED